MTHGNNTTDDLRFAFGKNWQSFLGRLNDTRIQEAERSLSDMLETDRLDGRSLLDIGSGSGLFSLAARRLGASVRSFDYDADAVACARELKRRYFSEDSRWLIEQGSVLDEDYVRSLGQFDIVYSWGVLHHTGNMWKALENAAIPVQCPGGLLCIAIYNDQGSRSERWKAVKRLYCRMPRPGKALLLALCAVRLWGPTIVKDTLRLHPLRTWSNYIRRRGMSPWHDVVDWVGGYPFEVATPEAIFRFYRDRGFRLRNLATAGGSIGNNRFVFEREPT